MYQEGWIVVNEVPTHVRTWGGWIEDEKINSQHIIVCITGNPGVTGFYCEFLKHLNSILGVPAWVINHAGLEFSSELKLPSIKKNPHLYNLEGQIEHKLKFIKEFVPSNKKIIIIGHSVGSKMVTGVLRERKVLDQVIEAYFLFPTLQHIAKSPLGKIYTKYHRFFVPFILCLVWVVSWLPKFIKNWSVNGYFRMRRGCNPDKNCKEAALQLINVKALRAATFLATDEMDAIQDLDMEVLTSLGDRVNCYYGEKDGWAPVWQCHDLANKCPKANTTILDKQFKHAFVLASSQQMAQIIANDVKTKHRL